MFNICPLYTVHYILYTVHYITTAYEYMVTIYNVHCTVYDVRCIVYGGEWGEIMFPRMPFLLYILKVRH